MDATERALAHLAASGIPAYRPGVRVGPCRTPYVVVRDGGSYPLGTAGGTRAGYRVVTLYCYAPRAGGGLRALTARVRRAMRALAGQIVPTGVEGPETLEPEFDACGQAIEYRAMLPPER